MVQKMQNYLASSFWTACGAISGVAATLTLGFFAWSQLEGPMLIVLAIIVSGVVATICKTRGLNGSVIAAALGGFLGAYGAVASGEFFEPGSLDWVIRGGVYGVCLGGMASLMLSPLGWIGLPAKSSS